MNQFKNILIVRTDRIGDIILTTPSIQALREAFPQARITILVSAKTVELVRGNPYLNEVMVDDRQNTHRGFFGFLRLIKEIKRGKFDLAIVYHTKKRTNLLCFMAGIPLRIGYKNNKYGFLLNRPLKDVRHLGKKHEIEYCLDVLKEIGVQGKRPSLFIPLEEKNEEWADKVFKENKLQEKAVVAIHPGASDPSRIWPEECFVQLIKQLKDAYNFEIVLIGSPDMMSVAQKIMAAANTKITNLTGQTTLGQLVSSIKRCCLLISNDSGPVHIAGALGIPIVAIFTRNQPGINPERWKPMGDKARVVSVATDDSISFKKAGQTPSQNLKKIQPKDVLEAVDSIFKLC